MGIQIVPGSASNLPPTHSEKYEVIPALVDRVVASRCNDEADELARSLHAVIALLDGRRH